MKPVLQMRNGQKIPYVESCKHLGNEISTVNKKLLIQNAKCDLNCRMNSLLADFSYCNSDTISMLFKSYCMNIYGSQIWKFYNKEVNIFYTAWRKAIRQIYKLPYRTHNILINHIIQCYPNDIILEKRCIKCIWGLMNSEHILFNNIIKFSLFNMSTTIGENIKYFMYKYNITMSDWYNSFSCIDKKIDVYVNRNVDMNVKYTAHQYKIYVKCGTFIILNYLIMLKLNNLFNICVLNDLYVFYTYTKCRYCINMCVYHMYNIYTVFLLLFITVLFFYCIILHS